MIYGEAFAALSETALIKNCRLLLQRADGARMIAVVKANAYGHGTAFAVRALLRAGVEFFAVARLSEALTLRGLCPHADVLILGATPPEYAPLLSRENLIQTVHSAAYARELSLAADLPVRVHLKLDCGMGRFGISLCSPSAEEDAAFVLGCLPLRCEAIYSHLPCADDPSPDGTLTQIGRVHAFRAKLAHTCRRLPLHLLASAGVLRFGGGGYDFIRPGLALYGYPPAPHLFSDGFLPVLTLYAPILAVRTLAAGDRIGYGGDFTAPRPMRIALLGIGYGDGIPRALTGAYARIGDTLCQIVGRICMDLTFCALPDGVCPRVGSYAVLFGDRAHRLPTLAAHAGTIPYELLTALTPRLSRQTADPL